jgi:hypothetical protein
MEAVTGLPTGANVCEIWAVVDQSALPADTTTRRIFSYGGPNASDRRIISRTVSGGVNRFNAGGGNGASEATITQGSEDFTGRCYVRAVFNGTTVKAYTNGVASGGATALVPATGTTRARVGANSGSSVTVGTWQGGISDIIVFDRLLTDAEVAQMNAWAEVRRLPNPSVAGLWSGALTDSGFAVAGDLNGVRGDIQTRLVVTTAADTGFTSPVFTGDFAAPMQTGAYKTFKHTATGLNADTAIAIVSSSTT